MLGTVFRQWLENFINLIYPLSCLICKVRLNPSSDKPLCTECWKKISFILPPFCRRCGKHLPVETQDRAFICRDCQSAAYFFKRARSVCAYEGIIKECVHLFKYNGKLALAGPLGRLMIDFADKFLDMENVDYIIPVPLHRAKQRQRQFNQAELLARALAKAFTKELKASLLVKIKATGAQVNLSQDERRKNVQGAFAVKKAAVLKDSNILLVDDVLTTKATVNECAKVLLVARANRVDVFTLASGS